MSEVEVELSDEFAITKRFKNSTEFSLFIEEQIIGTGLSYLEMLVDYCDTNNVEHSAIKSLISPSLREKIRLEAEELSLMRKKGTPALEF